MKKLIVVLALLVCVNCAAADIVSQLHGYWKVDGDLTDSSVKGIDLTNSYGHAFDATDKVNNSTHSLATTLGTSGGAGARGAAVDGASNCTYALSMSCWFKWDETPGTTQLISYMNKWGGSAPYEKYFNLYSYGSDRIDFNLGNVYNNVQGLIVTGLTINTGSWYHLAVTVDTNAANQNEVMKMYLTEEGSASVQPVGAMAWAPSDGSTGTSQVINYLNDAWFNVLPSWNCFTGNADEFRFYQQRSLSTADVQEIYDLEVVPEPATMVILAMGSAFVALKRRRK